MSPPSAQASGSAIASQAGASIREQVKVPQRRGATELREEDFTVRLPILGARVEASKIGKTRSHPILKGWILDIPKYKSIVEDPSSSEHKILRLRVGSENDLPEEVKAALDGMSTGFTHEVIELGYDYWTASDILNSIIPHDETGEAPSSFTTTGHIGHVNLRDEWLPYKSLIGQVLLDKNPKLRTIVNKLNTIHALYRYFDMEVLAGEHDFLTTVNESNCSFTFDFRKVYWNSRLHHEHERLVNSFKEGEVIADVMAGVGPFAVPAAKKGCYVFGNDLNPESVKWMRENRTRNHVEPTLQVSETDGREFIRSTPKEAWVKPFTPVPPPVLRRKREELARKARQAGVSLPREDPPETKPQEIDHFVLNLPDSALTFLDAYIGSYTPLLVLSGYSREEGKMPMIHVYCFTREIESGPAEKDICERARGYLQYDINPSSQDYNLHFVRSVAPNKDMYCLSFRLPKEVAFASPKS